MSGTWIRSAAAMAAVLLAVVPGPSAMAADSNAMAQITIRQDLGALAPSHTAPAGWSCTDSNAGGVYTVTCTPTASPPSGSWVCPGPSVVASYLGSPLDTHVGTSGCGGAGGASATCSPQQVPLVTNVCTDSAAGPAAMPFRCVVDYSGITPATVEWTVLCRTFT